MNNRLQQYARAYLKLALIKLPRDYHELFKRIYSIEDLNKELNSVVDAMNTEDLDVAMQQVDSSLAMESKTEGAGIDIFTEHKREILNEIAGMLYLSTRKYRNDNAKHAIADVRADVIGMRNAL